MLAGLAIDDSLDLVLRLDATHVCNVLLGEIGGQLDLRCS